MDRKQREDFDSTLNSGLSSTSWAHVESQAWERLSAGIYDQDPDQGKDIAGSGGE